MDVSIPKELLNKLINLGGIEKKLKCKSCNKFTDHISVSYSEGADSTFDSFAGRVFDLLPTNMLVWGNPYVCTKCGRIKCDGGLFSDWWNKNNYLRSK